MFVTTLERLDRLEEGQVVRIDGVDWTRSKDGLTRGETTLPLLVFRPMAEAKQIQLGEGIDPSTLPQWRGGAWLVVSEDPVTGEYLTLRFDGNRFYRIEMLRYQTVNGMNAGVPDYTPTSDAWVDAMSAVMDRVQPVGFLGDGGTVDGDLIDALHEYARDHNDLDFLLTEHGVGRMRRGMVTVEARGTSRVTSAQIGHEGLEIEGDPVVGWKFSYTFPAISNVSDPCLCVTFERALYEMRLPEQTVSDEVSVTCTEEDCVNK